MFFAVVNCIQHKVILNKTFEQTTARKQLTETWSTVLDSSRKQMVTFTNEPPLALALVFLALLVLFEAAEVLGLKTTLPPWSPPASICWLLGKLFVDNIAITMPRRSSSTMFALTFLSPTQSKLTLLFIYSHTHTRTEERIPTIPHTHEVFTGTIHKWHDLESSALYRGLLRHCKQININ